MKLFEFQAKELFSSVGIPVERHVLCDSISSLVAAYKERSNPQAVIKAQVKTGGRGKAGGIRSVKSLEEVESFGKSIFSLSIKGFPVKSVLLSDLVSIQQEIYLSLTIDRNKKSVLLIASSSGGVDIEDLAKNNPAAIVKQPIDILVGVPDFLARNIAAQLTDGPQQAKQISAIIQSLYSLLMETDASLLEINPLVVTTTGEVIALDGKVVLDDNALYRHPQYAKYRLEETLTGLEQEARDRKLSYVQLEGDIGCMVNGAGLAMTTMDLIKLYGGLPANFLDIGGSSSPEKVIDAMRILLSDKKIKAILINIFGGITRCDDVAKGLIEALSVVKTELPIVIRLTGTNEKEAVELLTNAGMTVFQSMNEATQEVVRKAYQNKQLNGKL